MEKANFLKGQKLFTSESVTEGHPDKMADQISDAVLDAILTEDPNARVACETLITTGVAMIAGEVSTEAYVHLPDIVRSTVKDIGYDSHIKGFDYNTCAVMSSLDQQSPDISMGVTEGEGLHKELGAGDQGLMFGYACKETDVLMPAPIHYAHRLTERLSAARKDGTLPFLRPDGKSQVTFLYENGEPKEITAVVISSQHSEDVSHEKIVESIREEVVAKAIPSELLSKDAKLYINPTGRFVVGGPQGDCGLTGRKIIVDTYGGAAPHGGGAFSGKDSTKVDRSASYMARYIAKNIVAAELADECLVQLAYAIGVADPVSVLVSCSGSAKVPEDRISMAVREVFGLKPAEIIESLQLRRPIFRPTAAYGHFGRPDFPWEKTDKTEALKKIVQ